MSLFKSLQSIPGVITVFHSPHNSKSLELLKILNKHQVSAEQASTGNSWLSRLLSLAPSGTGKTSLTKELDEILNKDTEVSVSNDFRNALYYIDIQNKFPTAQQFKLIYDYARKDSKNQQTYEAVFPKMAHKDASGTLVAPDSKILKELALLPIGQIKPDVFVAPLVVDWLKQKITNNAQELSDILEQYK